MRHAKTVGMHASITFFQMKKELQCKFMCVLPFLGAHFLLLYTIAHKFIKNFSNLVFLLASKHLGWQNFTFKFERPYKSEDTPGKKKEKRRSNLLQ